MRKARAEVDDVLGDQQLQPEDLSKFPYLTGAFDLVFPRGSRIDEYLISLFAISYHS